MDGRPGRGRGVGVLHWPSMEALPERNQGEGKKETGVRLMLPLRRGAERQGKQRLGCSSSWRVARSGGAWCRHRAQPGLGCARRRAQGRARGIAAARGARGGAGLGSLGAARLLGRWCSPRAQAWRRARQRRQQASARQRERAA
jgi:hypothetical protein